MPHRDRYLFVCTNRRDPSDPRGSCAARGSEEVVVKLKESLKAARVAGKVRACSSSCLDLCETGVTVLQEPEHVVYGGVTLADVEEIVATSARGGVVERLVVPRPVKRAALEGAPAGDASGQAVSPSRAGDAPAGGPGGQGE